MQSLILGIVYFILAILAVPQAVDSFDAGKRVSGSILVITAFALGMAAALGINVGLIEMGL